MPALSPLHIVGNILAIMATVLATAFAVDWSLVWLGGQGWAFCTVFPWISQLLGHTAGVAIASTAFVAWALSLFQSAALGALFAGGLVLGVMPGVIAQYLGAPSCQPAVQAASVPIPTPRPAHGGGL